MVNQKTENQQIINNITDELELNPIHDVIPRHVNPTIQPVYEVNQKRCDIVRSLTRTATGNGTIFATASDKDFYLTSIHFSVVADATADNVLYTIDASTNATFRNLVTVQKPTTTAFNEVTSISYPVPVKIDRGTAIRMGSTFTVGTTTYIACITGFTQEANNQFATG